jgi:hypothetical protein
MTAPETQVIPLQCGLMWLLPNGPSIPQGRGGGLQVIPQNRQRGAMEMGSKLDE